MPSVQGQMESVHVHRDSKDVSASRETAKMAYGAEIAKNLVNASKKTPTCKSLRIIRFNSRKKSMRFISKSPFVIMLRVPKFSIELIYCY